MLALTAALALAGPADASTLTSGGYQFRTVDDPHGIGATVVNGVNDADVLAGFCTDGAGSTDGMTALPR